MDRHGLIPLVAGITDRVFVLRLIFLSLNIVCDVDIFICHFNDFFFALNKESNRLVIDARINSMTQLSKPHNERQTVTVKWYS